MPGAKETIWKAEYLKCFNATEAARRAGYKWPNKVGPRLKKKFSGWIAEELAARSITPEIIIDRLTEQALASYSEYMLPDGSVDIASMIAAGKAHLIKSVKQTKYGKEIEFYDAHAALVDLGRHNKLFTDNVNVSGRLDVPGLKEMLDKVYGSNDDSRE